MVVLELSTDDIVQVRLHLLELASQCFKSIDLFDDDLAELTLACILDVSQEMLNTDLFGLSCSNG